MSCCSSCAIGGSCESTCNGRDSGGSRDRERNPSAVRLDLAAGQELGSASVPEIIQVYQGPVWLELWSYDADTSWYIQRQRVGREGQRIVTDQRVNSGPVSRRVVFVAAGERATVRAWIRAVSSGSGFNDVTGRYTASTPTPYVLVQSYDTKPYEYGAASSQALTVSGGFSEVIVAAHHARFLTIYADPTPGRIDVEDRSGTPVATFALNSYQVLNVSDAWPRVRVTNTGGVAINIYWIATVEPPGMV